MQGAYNYQSENARLMAFWVIFRMEKGWLMAKDRQYWSHLATEVPERYIRPLEAKFAAKQPLWVDDYAEFATHLQPGQDEALSDLVVHFPEQPVAGSGAVLRLWAHLSGKEKRKAMDEGILAASMDVDGTNMYVDILRRDALFGLMDPKLIVSFLPGGPPLPDDMRLFYRDTTEPGVVLNGSDQFPLHVRFGTGYTLKPHPVQGAVFSFGVAGGPKVDYQVTINSTDPTVPKD
jgi:hypothetical protein